MDNFLFIEETSSTNVLIWELLQTQQLPECFVVQTDFQTAGKGQTGNSWEAEKGKNLLFSMVLYPTNIPMDRLFLISQLVSVSIKNGLDKLTNGITIKWPNDIYWNDKKLAGILVENSFQADKVKTVVGVGLNVNQQEFKSDAPNPVSLSQIMGKPLDVEFLLVEIMENIRELYTRCDGDFIRNEYTKSLYRSAGYHPFLADGEIFQAKILAVQSDGQLELETLFGERKGFYFKEVRFV